MNYFKVSDIKFKLILLVAFMVAVFFGYKVFDRTKKEFIDTQISINDSKSRVLESRIDQWLLQRKTEVATLANTPIIRTMDWNKSGPFLKSKHNRMPWFYIFAHINPDGSYYNSKVDFAKGKNLKDRVHFEAAMQGRVYASDPVASKTLGSNIVAITSPIYSNDSLNSDIIGVFGGMIDSQTIVSELSTFKNGPKSYAFALNSEGIAISHPDINRMGTTDRNPISLLKDLDPGTAAIAKLMLEKKAGTKEINIDGQDVFVSFVPLSEADWYVATVTDSKFIRSRLSEVNFLGALSLILLSGAFLLIWQFRKQETLRLLRERESIEAKSEAKTMFLANMSHELRTPLHGILGYSELLLAQPRLSSSFETYLKTIQESGQHLLKLINSVLELSKIEAGKMELQLKPVKLADEIESLLRILQIENGKRDTSFKWHVSVGGQQFALVDIEKLRQVITNITVNAFKYGRDGEVAFSASVDSSNGQNFIKLSISDQGIGMSSQQIKNAFLPFDQVDTSSDGAGLGLTIVKKLLDVMGGSIEIDSDIGSGTTVHFEIPFTEVADSVAAPTGRKFKNLPFGIKDENKVILVIGDNQQNRQFMRDLLLQIGFQVELAVDGKSGIALFFEREFDLVITDLVMPNLDGFGVISAIRNGKKKNKVPIIVTSASAFNEDIARSLAAGCDVFLAKPTDPKLLLEHIGSLLNIEYKFKTTKIIRDDDLIGDIKTVINFSQPEVKKLLDQILQAANLGRLTKIQYLIDGCGDDFLKFELTHRFETMIENFDIAGIISIVQEMQNSDEQNNDQ